MDALKFIFRSALFLFLALACVSVVRTFNESSLERREGRSSVVADPESNANENEKSIAVVPKDRLAVVPKNCVKRAVLIGVNDYAEFKDLKFAGADVELIRKTLIELLGFKEEDIVALTTERGAENAAYAPTQRNIERELKKALDASGPDDMLFLMFSGHGLQIEQFDGFAPYIGFAPADAVADKATVVDFSTTVSLSWLYQELEKREIKFKWTWVDACRENLREAARSLDDSKRIRPFDVKGVVSMTSCNAGEYSYELPELGHGLFTYYFVQSLGEVGDANEDGVVTFFEAFSRTRDLVYKRTGAPIFSRRQTPYCRGDFTDFPLTEVKTAAAKKLYKEAVEAREVGDYAAALRLINDALELAPTKQEYRTEKRRIEEQKRNADAKKFEEDAIAAYDLGNYDEAISRMECSLALVDSEGNRRLLERFKNSDDKPAKARKIAEEARLAFENGEYKTAKTRCEEALKIADLSEIRELATKVENALAAVDWRKTYPAGTRKILTVDGVEYGFVYCPPTPTSREKKGFWTLESEVTVGMFRSFVKATNYRVGSGENGRGGHAYKLNGRWTQSLDYTWDKSMFPRTDEHPVVQVDYQAAVAFCEWLAEKTDLPIRLPKESEWQWAAGAGEGGRSSGGEITDYANVADASLARHFITGSMVRGDDGYAFTAPVKSLKPNKWNLYDMYGNVWELCGDYYSQQLNSCVLRGGSWNFGAESSRYDARCYYSPVSRDDNVGFRPIVRL